MRIIKCRMFMALLLLAALIVSISFWNTWLHTYLPVSSSNGHVATSESSSHIDLKFEQGKIYSCDQKMINDANYQLNDLLRIKRSVLDELQTLEDKRNIISAEYENYVEKLDELQLELQNKVKEMELWRQKIDRAQVHFEETVQRNSLEVHLPKKTVVEFTDETSVKREQAVLCTMDNCFDHSKCPMTSKTRFKFVDLPYDSNDDELDSEACTVFIKSYSSSNVQLRSQNAVVVDVSKPAEHFGKMNQNIIASATFLAENFRPEYDFVIPPLEFYENEPDYWRNVPSFAPARRKYLLSYLAHVDSLAQADGFIFEYFRIDDRQASGKNGGFYVDVDCEENELRFNDRSAMCNDVNIDQIFASSTYSLIVVSNDFATTFDAQARLIKALKFGAIPVILGHFYFPFFDLIDWRKCALILPKSRIYELIFYLRAFPDPDIFELRRHCRLFYDAYFSSDAKIIKTLASALLYRLHLPRFDQNFESPRSFLHFNESYKPVFEDIVPKTARFFDRIGYLGPLDEEPEPSPTFKANFSWSTLLAYESWNRFASPFHVPPFHPFYTPMPSEAKFLGSSYGFRPINNGLGGSGKFFCESLGGDIPKEQFTIVLLTYEREQVLIEALARLKNLPYLNKVIVVWNGDQPPSVSSIWPNISAPYIIIKTSLNSLNNRFFPYREIETEAVLSIDDDVDLRHDEIIFAFRVWRESRDRIVGFPGRYHGWEKANSRWVYNSNHSCELSMVLTGAAFIHKYYLDVYTHDMNDAIKQKVDELMNCEDIAMNFLVAHITRKPPLKVTSRWSFPCRGCTTGTLWADESHFTERHDCLNFFSQVYGYNPLINTQFRVDSVLFKTRVPEEHQRCFRFV